MRRPFIPLLIGMVTIGLSVWTSWTMHQLPPLGPRLPLSKMPVMYKLFSEQPAGLVAVPVVLTGLAVWCLRARVIKTGLYATLLVMAVLFLALVAAAIPPTLEIAKNGPPITVLPQR